MTTPTSAAEVKAEFKGDVLVLRIRGRLDAISSSETEKKICDSIEEGQGKVLLDMAAVTYLSSAGMRMLLSTTKRVRSFAGRMVLCSTANNVLDVLKISGFDHVLELFKTEEEAIKQL